MTLRPDWDAATYQRVSRPQLEWGRGVLDRLALVGSEHVLDAGCGTGRVTAELLAKLRAAGGGGRVRALDRSPDMCARARAALPREVAVVRADLLAIPFAAGAFDVVFSTATFHWVLDPAALYAGLARILRPGGRLHAQCGGEGNLERVMAHVRALRAAPRWAERFRGFREPWVFLSPAAAERHLRAAGFTDVRTGLEPRPTPFADRAAFREFLASVVLADNLARLPDERERAAFVDAVCDAAGADEPPWTLDYVRLNLEATRGARG
ncbi:MAG TPA: methyltransferase domain-containing protein [Candidatus Eisenbacteria bacterium]|nr:methyltransferase domain-containing protein [Candidatus Eisenbacteria bacterium]